MRISTRLVSVSRRIPYFTERFFTIAANSGMLSINCDTYSKQMSAWSPSTASSMTLPSSPGLNRYWRMQAR